MNEVNLPSNPKIAIAGSVNSSLKVLKKLIDHDMNLKWVLGLDPEASKNVSGFQDLKPTAKRAGLDFDYFKKINVAWVINGIKERDVDLFFVVGLSQLVHKDLLNAPNVRCIGYHPTKLPKGRGRAAIAWIILGKAEAAASFFLLEEGPDNGQIIAQKPVPLQGDEYAQDIINKIMDSIDEVLDEILPSIKKGALSYTIQDESEATYLGKRAPSDGYLDFSQPAENLQRLIRAVSHPLPGGITFLGNKELRVWKSEVYSGNNFVGVPGRVLRVLENSFIVQTGDGLLRITDWEGADLTEIVEGNLLGINMVTLYRKILRNKL